jgi:hypothetical protein
MASVNGQEKASGARLGTRLRGKLADAYEARGGQQNILWLHYSAKARSDVALCSDLEYGHFLLVESDPLIDKVNYAPAKQVARIAGEVFATIVDAEVQTKNGEVTWREVKYSGDLAEGEANRANLQILIQQQAARDTAVRHEVLTEKEIFACPQRIRNWHRVMVWLAAAREWALHDYATKVAILMRRHGRIEFHEALSLGDTEHASLYGAALLQEVQRGTFRSDLEARPLTARSIFYAPERS